MNEWIVMIYDLQHSRYQHKECVFMFKTKKRLNWFITNKIWLLKQISPPQKKNYHSLDIVTFAPTLILIFFHCLCSFPLILRKEKER